MNNYFSLFLLILFSAFAKCITAQTNAAYNHTLTKAQLHEDIDILKHQFESIHPGLYLYSSKEEVDQAFAKLKVAINGPLTDLEFYRLLAPLQGVIKNGHTMIIPSKIWGKHKVENLGLFPFEVYWDDDRLYVLKNLSNLPSGDENILLGTEIKSINGQAVTTVIEQILGSITRDGNNHSYPIQLMQLGFEQWYADIIGTPSSFQLEIITPNGTAQNIQTQALTLATLNQNHLDRYKAKRVLWYQRGGDPKLSLKINDNIATLRVPTFGSSSKGDNGKKYKAFHKDAFRQIKEAGVEHLILDLRDNGGGDPMPQLALLTHLLDEPVQLYKRTYAIFDEIPNPEYYNGQKVKHLKTLAKLALKKRGDVYEETGNLFARLNGAEPKKPVKPAKNLYQGKLYILTDGGSFSATGEVAGLLKNANRGVFIGEEAGGSDFQNTSGLMPMLYLPNSQVRVRNCLLTFELNVDSENDGYGVQPDHPIRNSIDDVLNNRDAVMEYTVDLIQSKTSHPSQDIISKY